MIVVTLWKARQGLTADQQAQGFARRVQWQPKGRMLAEYWFQGSGADEPAGLTIADVTDVSQLFEDLATWQDLLEVRSYIAVSAEDGLRLGQQLGLAQVAAR